MCSRRAGGQQVLVFLGAITGVIALYYYLMVARQVHIADPADPADDRRMSVARPLSLAISICVIGTLAIGIYPRPFVALGEKAATIPAHSVPGSRQAHRSARTAALTNSLRVYGDRTVEP